MIIEPKEGKGISVRREAGTGSNGSTCYSREIMREDHLVGDHTLLIVHSNPEDSEPLRLDRERRSLTRVIKDAGFSPSRMTILDAASVSDVLHELADKPYSLMHFSGHGEQSGIFVEGLDPEKGDLIDAEFLEEVLVAGQPYLKMALFLSCFSASFADRLIAHVPYIIAVNGRADDEQCIRFVDCFYTRLLRGDDPERAFSIARRSARDLDIVLLRRAVRDGNSKALVQSYTYESHPTLYVDVSKVTPDIKRLGLREGDLLRLMSRKIYYHAFAFRYPRSNAILSVGEFFASFSWENADDCIACERLFRLKDDASPPLSQAFVELLISYSDRYVANYRSPIAPYEPDYKEQVNVGIMKMIESYQHFFGEGLEPSSEGRASPFLRLSSNWPSVLSDAVPSVFKTSKAIGSANLAMAEQRYRGNDIPACVAHLEAALSSFHDLTNAVSQCVLD